MNVTETDSPPTSVITVRHCSAAAEEIHAAVILSELDLVLMRD